MRPSERPPRDDPDHGEPESEPREGTRRLLERILREGVKRVVEKGVEQISDGPESVRQFISDIKLPKELAHLVFQQLDETKAGLYRVVAREIRDVLEHTNLAEELTRALTTLSFEIKTEIRFIPNSQKVEGGLPRPDVKASVKIRDNGKELAAPEAPSGEHEHAETEGRRRGRRVLHEVQARPQPSHRLHGRRSAEKG